LKEHGVIQRDDMQNLSLNEAEQLDGSMLGIALAPMRGWCGESAGERTVGVDAYRAPLQGYGRRGYERVFATGVEHIGSVRT
jgi:hypothetical protein